MKAQLLPSRNTLFLIFVLALTILTPEISNAATDEPVAVAVEIFLADLDGVDDVQQGFAASVFLMASWHDPELAHNGRRPISRSLTEVWNPRIQIVNQQHVFTSFPLSVEISPDGTVTQRQRYWGNFSQPLSLEKFPFDSQKLEVQVVAVGMSEADVSLQVSPRSGVSGEYSIIDWDVTSHSVEATGLPLGLAGTDIPAVILTVEVDRHESHYMVKVVLPLVLIVAMSMLVFWIDPQQSGTQISVATTAMLTLIANRFAIGAALPKLSFLTLLDYFVMGSTLLVFTSLVMVIWTSALVKQDRTAHAQKIDRVARWLMPILFLALTLETLRFNLLV